MEQRISIERMEQAVNLFGSFDENVRLIESEFKVTISNREGELRVNGEVEDTMLAVKALNALLTISNRGEPITEQNVRYVISLVRAGQEDRISELTQDVICISSKGRPIKPKTIGQKKYIESVLKNTITIGVGPAGTGKTYLAVAAAVAAFRERKVNRIILPANDPLSLTNESEAVNFTIDMGDNYNPSCKLKIASNPVNYSLPKNTKLDLTGYIKEPLMVNIEASEWENVDEDWNISGIKVLNVSDLEVSITDFNGARISFTSNMPVSYTHLTLPTNSLV